jgi:hypothetical protein
VCVCVCARACVRGWWGEGGRGVEEGPARNQPGILAGRQTPRSFMCTGRIQYTSDCLRSWEFAREFDFRARHEKSSDPLLAIGSLLARCTCLACYFNSDGVH